MKTIATLTLATILLMPVSGRTVQAATNPVAPTGSVTAAQPVVELLPSFQPVKDEELRLIAGESSYSKPPAMGNLPRLEMTRGKIKLWDEANKNGLNFQVSRTPAVRQNLSLPATFYLKSVSGY